MTLTGIYDCFGDLGAEDTRGWNGRHGSAMRMFSHGIFQRRDWQLNRSIQTFNLPHHPPSRSFIHPSPKYPHNWISQKTSKHFRKKWDQNPSLGSNMKMDENGGCFPTFNLPKILSSQVSWDSEPCRLWAFGVRGWIPFELRSNRWDDWSSRAPAPGGKFQGKTSFFRQFFMRYYLWLLVFTIYYYCYCCYHY